MHCDGARNDRISATDVNRNKNFLTMQSEMKKKETNLRQNLKRNICKG